MCQFSVVKESRDNEKIFTLYFREGNLFLDQKEFFIV